MKVLHILDSLNRGGAEILALDICRNAKANNLDLIFAATGGGELEDDFRRSGVDFIRLERNLPLDLKLSKQLQGLINERGIEIVHVHQAVEAAHAYLAKRGTRAKLVLSFHLCTADAKNTLALKFLVPRVDANVAVSRNLLECLQSEARFDTTKSFHVIYNGVDATRLKAPPGKLRAELGLSENDLLLGMVGNFYPDARKDQMTICRALPELFVRLPNTHFVFAGSHASDAPQVFDECVDYCRQQGITGRVHFLGQRADVAAVLNSLDIFVFSSRKDSFGVAAVEAMMVGLPTVVSDIGPLLEISGNGEYAKVFRTGDHVDLARVLEELSNSPPDRTQLASRGKSWATQQFSIQEHVNNLLHLYNSLAASW
jgi:glycosyltransferase involved in cell wall biosynthesis